MNEVDCKQLKMAVIERLMKVIDPETGVDVIRMRLVLDLQLDDQGNINYIFRPSSPLCPLATTLILDIIRAISEVPGINHQDINVIDYVQANELNDLLKDFLCLKDARIKKIKD